MLGRDKWKIELKLEKCRKALKGNFSYLSLNGRNACGSQSGLG